MFVLNANRLSSPIFSFFSRNATLNPRQQPARVLTKDKSLLKGAFRGQKLDIGELRRLHIKRT